MGVQRRYKEVGGICRRVRGYMVHVARRVRGYMGEHRRYKRGEGICRKVGENMEE